MGQATEEPWIIAEEIPAVNDRVMIFVQVRWLSNLHTISDREQRGEMMATSVVLILIRKKVAQRQVTKEVTVVGVNTMSSCTQM